MIPRGSKLWEKSTYSVKAALAYTFNVYIKLKVVVPIEQYSKFDVNPSRNGKI